jgi:hypothetical protein
VARVLIDVEESEIRSRGRLDLAAIALEDRPLVIVGSRKELARAAAEMVAAWRASSRTKSVRVAVRGVSGVVLRTWRAELKGQALELEQTRDGQPGTQIGTLVGIDLSAKPAKRTDVRIAVY